MNAVTPVKAGRREWIGLVVLCLPALLTTMDLTLLFMAVPKLTADLNPSSSQLLWASDIYGFLIAGFLITMGTVGERIGRRRLLMIGAVFFGVASVLTAYADSPEMLIAARALLGVAAATLAPSTLSLLRTMFKDEKEGTTAVTIWTTSFMVGGVVGPIAGGLLLDHFWWGAPFLLAVPVMILLLVAGPMLLPEYKDPAGGRLDLVSVGMSLAAILPAVYGVKELAREGFETLPAVSLVIGLAFGVAFVLRQRGLSVPLLDISLFTRAAFSVSVGTLLLTTGLMMGIQYLLATYMQVVLGMSPAEAGLWQLPVIIPGMVAAVVGTGISQKIGTPPVLIAGLLVGSVGFGVLTQVDGGSGTALVVVSSAIMFIGLAPVMALGIGTIVQTAPVERAGAASALASTTNEMGGAVGIALVGSLATAVYGSTLDDNLPDGVTGQAHEAARNSVSEAATVAGELPGRVGGELSAAAHDAFAHGMEIASFVSIGVLLAMAALVAVLLRKALPAPAAPPEPQVAGAADESVPTPAQSA
ncbi:MFS transporter [Streptomyces phaeoluteigriseus]|uniref:MFS transporter n=1 Tax=Streptomyces phaeoluteigriseus TaxID=114686 RepID=UPI003682A45E